MDQLIDTWSSHYGIPRDLLAAIVQVESGGNPWAMRYESGYRWLWDVLRKAPYQPGDDFPSPRGVSSDSERIGQKTSWGLMQIMGAVARERGFDGPFLSKLCDPAINMKFGCMHLVGYYRRHGSWEAAAASYNAGSPRRNKEGQWINQIYIDRLRAAGWRG